MKKPFTLNFVKLKDPCFSSEAKALMKNFFSRYDNYLILRCNVETVNVTVEDNHLTVKMSPLKNRNFELISYYSRHREEVYHADINNYQKILSGDIRDIEDMYNTDSVRPIQILLKDLKTEDIIKYSVMSFTIYISDFVT